MRVAVMQPYFFPYLGYWQLMNAVDIFVIFDDVNYINKGYIDRNTILANGKPSFIKLELLGASQNKLINEIDIGGNRLKLLKKIDLAYKKSFCYNSFFPVVEKILSLDEKNLAKYLECSIRVISEYLKINTKIITSSSIECSESGKGKIIPIIHALRGDTYLNMIGGKLLYRDEDFAAAKIKLKFVEAYQSPYSQLAQEFIPNLSILDILFNVSPGDMASRLNFIR